MTKEKRVRFRTAEAWPKALTHYEELRAGGKLKQALVIAEDHTGHITVMAQGMRPHQAQALVLLGAQAIVASLEDHNAPRPETHQEPLSHGPKVGITTPEAQRGITKNAEGVLVPPPGETIISCGECFHPRWIVTMPAVDDGTAVPCRLACAACGNEMIFHRIHHAEGQA